MKYELIKETKDYLVINKPAGLLTHGAPHIDEPSLTDDLLHDYPEITSVGDDSLRPGLVHRIDKLVSGLLVVARTNASFESLKKQFEERRIEKIYTALVYGALLHDEGEIKFPIQRSRDGHRMAALPLTKNGESNPDGKIALSQFTVIKKYINYTLLKVQIKTGRTHQIRVHLSALGHPLVGDDLYATRKTKQKNQKLDLGRIFLVANELGFTDLSGDKQKFKIELPGKLIDFLSTKVK